VNLPGTTPAARVRRQATPPAGNSPSRQLPQQAAPAFDLAILALDDPQRLGDVLAAARIQVAGPGALVE